MADAVGAPPKQSFIGQAPVPGFLEKWVNPTLRGETIDSMIPKIMGLAAIPAAGMVGMPGMPGLFGSATDMGSLFQTLFKGILQSQAPVQMGNLGGAIGQKIGEVTVPTRGAPPEQFEQRSEMGHRIGSLLGQYLPFLISKIPPM